MYQMYKITDEMSLRNAIREYMRFYRDERPQSRYNCKTPAEVRSEALSSAVPQAYPIAKNKRIEKCKAKWLPKKSAARNRATDSEHLILDI